MIERPGTGRAKILTTGNTIDIQIPVKKNWFIIAFSIIWMCGWSFGIILSPKEELFREMPEAFATLWYAATVFAYVFCIAQLSWLLAGFEFIIVQNGVLEIGRKIFGLKLSKKYYIKDIRHLVLGKQIEKNAFGFGSQRESLSMHGNLKFDYGLKTINFCSTDEAESRQFLEFFKGNPNFNQGNFEQP